MWNSLRRWLNNFAVRDITDRRQTEQALRESERRYRMLFASVERQAQELALLDRVRAAVARELDLPAVLRTVVEAIAETFGYTQVALYLLRGDTLMLQHQVGYDPVIEEMSITKGISGRVARSGQPVLLEDVRTDPEFLGAIEDIVSEVCVPLLDQGRVVGMLNVESTQGVTLSEADLRLMVALSEHVSIAIGRARLYSEVRENEELFRALFEHSPDAILLIDPDTFTIVDCNRAACRMNGYSREELIGQPADRLNAVQVADDVRAAYVQYLRQVGSLKFEIEHRRKDGVVFPVEVSAAAISVAGRERLLGIDRDISERKRVEEAEREQRALAEALRDSAAALNSTLHLDEVLDRILTNVGRVVPHDAASVMLVEAGGAYIVRRMGYAEAEFEAAVMAVRFTVDDVPALRTMSETGRPIAIPDTRAYAGWVDRSDTRRVRSYVGWVDRPETRWVRSYVGAPIRLKGQVIGFLNLNSATPGFFTQAHIERLQAFADQAATAIENARLYQAERRRVETLAALHDTGLALSVQLDLQLLLQTIVERAARLLGTPMGELYLLLPDEETLELKVGYHLPHELTSLRMRLGEGFSGRVAQTGEPLIVGDYRTWPGRLVAYDHIPFGAVVGVPIKWQKRVVGVILVDDYQRDRFGATDVELLSLFANQAAVAIENARLFEVAQRRLEEQTALLAASAAISSSLDLSIVLHHLAEHMGQAIDATSIYICDLNAEANTTTVLAEYYSPEVSPVERVSDLGVTYDVPQEFGNAYDSWLWAGQVGVVHVDDPDLSEPMRAHLARYGGWSVLHIPLTVKGTVVGYAALWESRRRRDFTPQEIALCQGIAQQAAIAFENARLYDALHRHAVELEQRVAERTAELDRERQRLQAILDVAGEGIVLIDRDNAVVYTNAAMEQLTGYTFAEALGHAPRLWLSERAPPAASAALARSLERGEAWHGEVVNRRKDGSLYDAALTLNPLRDADDRVIGFVGVQRDITQLKELERLKNQFVSRIGHELRTPLSNLKLYLELLDRGKPDKRAQYMQTLHRETARLQRLIEGFLEMSQLDAGTVSIHLVPADLNQLVAHLIVDWSVVAAERGLALTVQSDPDLPRALVDPVLLAHALSNLMENALNYTPRGGQIVVTTAVRRHADRDWLTLTVQDTGPGFSPEDRLHLFERFYRGEAARDFSTPGAGLGLAICKAIVERLGGWIALEEDAGTDGAQPVGAALKMWLRSAN